MPESVLKKVEGFSLKARHLRCLGEQEQGFDTFRHTNVLLYEQIVELREQRYTYRRIAERVGVSRVRVGRWLKQGSHTVQQRVKSKIASYLQYAYERYDASITSMFLVYEILARGYVGTYAPLYAHFKAVRSGWGES